MDEKRKFDTNHLADLVEHRAKIGKLLLEIWKVSEQNPDSLQPPQSTIWHSLLGVAFSLWRAAFLIKDGRSQKTMNDDARKFLGILLEDNAINYTQDRETRAWTAGYYLNNACLRLDFVKNLLSLNGDQNAAFNKITSFLNSQKQSSGQVPNLSAGWEDACAAAEIVLGILQKRAA